MAWYRFYFLDSGGKIAAAENLEAADDAGAIDATRVVFASNDYPAYELWQGSRMVHKEIRITAS